jgi:toxin-antitoxin system PIN domain toxin
LLDINVLVALTWPTHVHHQLTQEWFSKSNGGFRTCPITQAGFVRVTSNPNFSAHAVSVRAALALLEEIVSLSGHEFWPDDLQLKEAIPQDLPIVGHQQVTDAYLLALAAARGGKVATLDRGMLALGQKRLVEIVGSE